MGFVHAKRVALARFDLRHRQARGIGGREESAVGDEAERGEGKRTHARSA